MKSHFLKSIHSFVGLLLILTIVPLAPAQAYFTTIETASENTVVASELEVTLALDNSVGLVGAVQPVFLSDIGVEHSSLSIARDIMFAADTVGDSAFCSALTLRIDNGSGDTAERSADSFLYGPLSDVAVLQLLDAELEFDSSEFGSVAHGAGCDVSLSVYSSQQGVVSASGFTDTQTITWNLTASQVVLNEVLADPATGQQEFIELFNNGSVPVDVAGWTIAEKTGSGATTTHSIVATPTLSADLIAYDDSGSTIVPAGGFLALKFAGSVQYLNNDGDTVTLLDGAGSQLDEYAYNTSLSGKSDARIPDGVGDWIDPVPTPGGPNLLAEPEFVVVLETTSLLTTESQASSSATSTPPADKETTNSSNLDLNTDKGSTTLAAIVTQATSSNPTATTSDVISSLPSLASSTESSQLASDTPLIAPDTTTSGDKFSAEEEVVEESSAAPPIEAVGAGETELKQEDQLTAPEAVEDETLLTEPVVEESTAEAVEIPKSDPELDVEDVKEEEAKREEEVTDEETDV